jgi:hypothetical protein
MKITTEITNTSKTSQEKTPQDKIHNAMQHNATEDSTTQNTRGQRHTVPHHHTTTQHKIAQDKTRQDEMCNALARFCRERNASMDISREMSVETHRSVKLFHLLSCQGVCAVEKTNL